jgi:hypothetical protein
MVVDLDDLRSSRRYWRSTSNPTRICRRGEDSLRMSFGRCSPKRRGGG